MGEFFDQVSEFSKEREKNGPKNILQAMIMHPNCCTGGSRYLSVQKDLNKAWDKCMNPFFIAWCLDFMMEYRLEPQGNEPPISLFYMRTWRAKIYLDFLQHEIGIPRMLLPIFAKLLTIPKVSLFAYWLTSGFADDRKNAWWWGYTSSTLKGIRRNWVFLEVDKQSEFD